MGVRRIFSRDGTSGFFQGGANLFVLKIPPLPPLPTHMVEMTVFAN